jgi:hypothetical protein
MTEQNTQVKKGDLVLVQPMKYSFSFTEGGIENLAEDDPDRPLKITHHWTEDGFKARVLEIAETSTKLDGEKAPVEEVYYRVKIFGKGRRAFTRRDNVKTKEVWIQARLTSKCPPENKKKKEK